MQATTKVADAGGEPTSQPDQLAALRAIQAYFQNLVPPGVSVVDELIAERRLEAAREEADNWSSAIKPCDP